LFAHRRWRDRFATGVGDSKKGRPAATSAKNGFAWIQRVKVVNPDTKTAAK